MKDQLQALLESNYVGVQRVRPVPHTHWYRVWLTRPFDRAAMDYALDNSEFTCIGGGTYQQRPVALIAVKAGV